MRSFCVAAPVLLPAGNRNIPSPASPDGAVKQKIGNNSSSGHVHSAMGIGASYLAPRTPPNVIWNAFEASMPDLAGKVVCVTGCTSGTGRQLALTAAKKGATVVALNRPSERADALLAELRAIVPECTSIDCDLSSFESTRRAAGELIARFSDDGLDTLCLNAGVMACEDVATVDGFDVQIQVRKR